MNTNNPSLLQAISLKNKEHINKINNVSKDLLLCGRYVKDKTQARSSSTSEVNDILQNKTNMSRDMKGKLYSFYSDFVSSNKNIDNPKGMNVNRMIALGCKQNSNLSNQNYDDIKQRENVAKTKNEIFGMLSNKPLTKRFIKSSSYVDMLNLNNNHIDVINEKNKIKSPYNNNFSDGIRIELSKMLNGRVTCNAKPKNISIINNTGNVQKDSKRNSAKRFRQSDDDDLQMKSDFDSLGDKCNKFQTKLKLFAL